MYVFCMYMSFPAADPKRGSRTLSENFLSPKMHEIKKKIWKKLKWASSNHKNPLSPSPPHPPPLNYHQCIDSQLQRCIFFLKEIKYKLLNVLEAELFVISPPI